MTPTSIQLEKINERIAILTLNRPKAANAMSLAMLDELNQTIDEIKKDQEIVCLIITGAGKKAFCAGADLKERSNMSDPKVIQTVKYIGDTITRIEELPIPVIAAINGAAYGGGLELALACDLRIALSQGKLGLTETSLAIIPGAGGTQRLPRLIGLGQAKRLIYTAKPINGEEALKLGLVEYIYDENILDHAIRLAKTISENGPIALQQAKQAIDQGIQVDLKTGKLIEFLAYQKTIPTKDRLEGLKAFQEKRKPRYKGK